MIEKMVALLDRSDEVFTYDADKKVIDLDDIRIEPYQDQLLMTFTICRREDDFELCEFEVDLGNALDMVNYVRQELLM